MKKILYIFMMLILVTVVLSIVENFSFIGETNPFTITQSGAVYNYTKYIAVPNNAYVHNISMEVFYGLEVNQHLLNFWRMNETIPTNGTYVIDYANNYNLIYTLGPAPSASANISSDSDAYGIDHGAKNFTRGDVTDEA
jgi:hypothetical protein